MKFPKVTVEELREAATEAVIEANKTGNHDVMLVLLPEVIFAICEKLEDLGVSFVGDEDGDLDTTLEYGFSEDEIDDDSESTTIATRSTNP